MPNNVMIMDVNVGLWQSIRTFLTERGYNVDHCIVASDALDKAQTQLFNLIIIDIGWPQLDGLSVLAELHRLQPEATILAVSEFADRDLETETRRLGANMCLTKPLGEEELLQAIISAQASANGASPTEPLPSKNIEQTLLRGFTTDQQWDFRMIGIVRSYQLGDTIHLDDEDGNLVWLEKGKVMVCYNGTPVESLSEGDFWGEEAFVNPEGIITYLVAQDEVHLRHFSRKRVIEYFAYHDETLTKRYMINLISCMHSKWNRTISRLVQSSQSSACNPSE